MALCINCGTRPRPKNNGRMRCIPCQRDLERIERDEGDRKKQCQKNRSFGRYEYLYHWRGYLVGLERTGDHSFTVRYLDWSGQPGKLPKNKLVDFDQWQAKYTAAQVKHIKNLILRLAHAPRPKQVGDY